MKFLGCPDDYWREKHLLPKFNTRYNKNYTTCAEIYRKHHDENPHLDEIIPCKYWFKPEDEKYLWHFLNSEILLQQDNLEKGATCDPDDALKMKRDIDAWIAKQSRA